MKLISFVALFLFSLVYKVNSNCEHVFNETDGGTSALSALQQFVGERMFAWRVLYNPTATTPMSTEPSRDLAEAALAAVQRVIATAAAALPDCTASPQYEWYTTDTPATTTACCQLTPASTCAHTYLTAYLAAAEGTLLPDMTAVNYIISAGSATPITELEIEAAVDAMVEDPQFDVVVVTPVDEEWGAYVGVTDGAGSGQNYIAFAIGTYTAPLARTCGVFGGVAIVSTGAPVSTTTPDPNASTTDPDASSSDPTTLPPDGTAPPTTEMSSSTSSAMAVFTSSVYLVPTICYLTLFITQ